LKNLEDNLAAESKNLAAKEIADLERKIVNLEYEKERLIREVSFKEGKVKSLSEELAKSEKGRVAVSKEVVSQETQTPVSETEKEKRIRDLEEIVSNLKQEIKQLKETEEIMVKETENLSEVKDTQGQTDKIEQLPQPQPENPSSSTTTGQLSPYSDSSAMLNSSRSIGYYSEEEEKITTDLFRKRQELIGLTKQAIDKEKEVMELRRKLFKIEYERISKQYEEKREFVTLIIQDLKKR